MNWILVAGDLTNPEVHEIEAAVSWRDRVLRAVRRAKREESERLAGTAVAAPGARKDETSLIPTAWKVFAE
jgi:hypothetical protein